MQGISKLFNELAWLTQLGFSFMMPPLLCIGGAWLCVQKLGAPLWIMLPAFVLGFGAAATSFYNFYKYTQKKAHKGTDDAPPAFNEHH